MQEHHQKGQQQGEAAKQHRFFGKNLGHQAADHRAQHEYQDDGQIIAAARSGGAVEMCIRDRGHTLAYYYDLYHCKHVLLLGRVMSGKGGDMILAEAKRVLEEEYSEIAGEIFPALPDEKFRRVGQSAAAASLPELKQ